MRNTLPFALFFWAQTIVLFAQPANDDFGSAILLSDLDNWCSSDGAYTNVNATSDLNPGSCWNTSPDRNVWFTFIATTTQIDVDILRGGPKGSIRRINAAIWEADGTTPVSCNRYVNNDDIVSVGAVSLTPGNTYFISVDNNFGSYAGTFTLCINDSADYDYYEGAIGIDSLMNSCSQDAAFTTLGATSDQNAGSCWNTSPNYNRWFKFTATTSAINITLDRGGSKGTIRRINAALWQGDGTTEIACNRYINNDDDVVVGAVDLTPGSEYYISVDNNFSGYRGTFTLCLDDEVDYDFYEGATNVTGLINSCSPDAAFSTLGATPDKNAASCWNTLPNYNRWFKFIAPASGSINVTVDRGGSKGPMRRANVAIWDTTGIIEIECNRYVNNDDDVIVGAVGLTPGDTYYISVDNNFSGYRGTFTLCLDEAVDYDFYEGAIDLTSLINSCSPDAAYTTLGATPDRSAASCWNTAPNYNRWFKFIAPASGLINVTVDRGGSKGTMRRTNVAIWDTTGTIEIECNRYINNDDVVVVGAIGLTPGDTYYISVDNNFSGYRGTFTLCLDDAVDYDFYEGAEDVTSLINTCSPDAAYSTLGATPDRSAASCWNTAPNYNRWFKFVAPATGLISITVDRGGVKGTMRRANVAIWESDGLTELACNRYVNNDDDVVVQSVSLTPGNEYYISVDNNFSGYRGTFTLCLNDQPDYDYYEGAILLADINNFCSQDAEYTTLGATQDLNAASCWNTSPNYNRWFRFVATTNFIDVDVFRGGSKGTIRRINVSIWENDGTTQVACNRYVNNDDNVSVGATNLVIGNTYYISIDNNFSGYRGTFTFCIDDEPDYDYYEGAIELTNLNNWCSSDAAFTTLGATSDRNAASCWNTGPNYNRWFRFQAVSDSVSMGVLRGGAQGNIRRINLALWEADGTTEVACSRYAGNDDNVFINYKGLTPGNTYYVSVDNNFSGYRGTFSLCIDNKADTYYSIANGAWDSPTNWSFVDHSGIPANSFPDTGDVAIIEHAMTISNDREILELNINSNSSRTSSLTIDGASLAVRGEANVSNTGDNQIVNLAIQNGAEMFVLDSMTMTRTGGNTIFTLSIDDATLLVNGSMYWNISGGSTFPAGLSMANNSFLGVTQNYLMNHTGGEKILQEFFNSSQITIGSSCVFSASGDDLVEMHFRGGTRFNLDGYILRGSPRYGILKFSDQSKLVFSSQDNLQIWPQQAGSGTGDSITYNKVEISNSRITFPQVSLSGPVSMRDSLILIRGRVLTSGSNLLSLSSSASSSEGSNITHIVGPMRKIGTTDFLFPLGDFGFYAPAEVNNITGGDASTAFTSEYFYDSYSDVTNIQAGLNNVSTVEYWQIDNSSGALSDASVVLHWKSQSRSDIDDYLDLKIVRYDGAEWQNLGQSNIQGTDPGYITVNNVATFSPFTFGSSDPNVNRLPVEFLDIFAFSEGSQVKINWSTASEINVSSFAIQRSTDLVSFEDIGLVDARGDDQSITHYGFLDQNPIEGTTYYRIREVNNGSTGSSSEIAAVIWTKGVTSKIYPNPAESGDIFRINLNERNTLHSLSIIQAASSTIKSLPFQIEDARTLICTAPDTPGMYIIEVIGEKQTERIKILVR